MRAALRNVIILPLRITHTMAQPNHESEVALAMRILQAMYEGDIVFLPLTDNVQRALAWVEYAVQLCFDPHARSGLNTIKTALIDAMIFRDERFLRDE